MSTLYLYFPDDWQYVAFKQWLYETYPTPPAGVDPRPQPWWRKDQPRPHLPEEPTKDYTTCIRARCREDGGTIGRVDTPRGLIAEIHGHAARYHSATRVPDARTYPEGA